MINFKELLKNTTLYSDQNSEYIRIHTISFMYNNSFLFYENTKLNASVFFTKNGIFVKFKDANQLRTIVGIVSFYKLNQFYHFVSSVNISLTSTLLYTTKPLEDIQSFSDALITIYESKIINQTLYEIHFRIFNQCSITLRFICIDEGYLIEILHNQINLYKQDFKKFTTDYCELLK